VTQPDDSLRVSDAERDAVLRTLGDHAAVGRLTLDELDVGGFSFMGGHEEVGSERPPRPGAPVIRIRVYNVMAGASIYRLPPQARGMILKDAQHLARAAERGELPAPD
jgi:hypothetical protein